MTYFIGLDIAKHKHDCFVMNEKKETVIDSFSFDNNAVGFNTLLIALKALDPSQEKRIGLEATGHYGTNLKIFLEEHSLSFMEFNPLLISRFNKTHTLRRTKTDKIDARVIALYLSTVDYTAYPLKSYHLQNLKSLTRTRDSLVKQRSLMLVKLTNVLDLMFPEFKPFFDRNLKSSTVQYILETYKTPSKMSRMTRESYDKMKSKLRRTISYAKFLKLKELAKNTVGREDEILTLELDTYLELYKELDSKIQLIESKIIEEYETTGSHIHTIPGIGMISAAGIYAEIGNISKFNNANQLTAYAGLDCSRYQSGESDYTGHMVKHGSSYLREYLMNVAETCMMHNPVIYEYYHKKRTINDKAHRVALSHVAKKLIRIIFSLEKHNSDYDTNKI